MKENVIRFRVSGEEKEAVRMLAEASPYTDSLSEYIMELIKEDAKNYSEISIEAVVYGPNKAKNAVIEKTRIQLGKIFVDRDGRGTAKQYDRLIKQAKEGLNGLEKRPNHHLALEVNGIKVDQPSPMTDFVRFI